VKTLRSVLICGWRPVWEDVPARLKKRLHELIANRLPGSSVTFINAVDCDHFENLMMEIDVVRSTETDIRGDATVDVQHAYEVTAFPGILIVHMVGNASKAEFLEPVVMRRAFNTAIVLGTQADVKLNARSRDTRVLCIMHLPLRKIWNVRVSTTGDATHMHIVGENEEDLTAKLALAPHPVDSKVPRKPTEALDHPPDFINTQAIYARALTQTLAYPLIAPAVADLFTTTEDATNVELVNVEAYVPLEIFEPACELGDGSGTIPWGIVRNCVLQAKGERSICIGYNTPEGEGLMCPMHDRKVRVFRVGVEMQV